MFLKVLNQENNYVRILTIEVVVQFINDFNPIDIYSNKLDIIEYIADVLLIIHYVYLMLIISLKCIWTISISYISNQWYNQYDLPCDYIEMLNILLLINCHFCYVTVNFRVAQSVKCLHSITHSFDRYLYSQITIQLSLTLHHSINYHISTYSPYPILSFSSRKFGYWRWEFIDVDHLLISIACGRVDE